METTTRKGLRELSPQEINFTEYMDRRLSPEQVRSSSTLVTDDNELSRFCKDLIQACSHYWDNLEPVREKYFRNVRYYKGDQWSDKIYDPDKEEWVTEGDHIKSQGKVPLKQNQIIQIVKNLVGQFRENDNTSIVISRKRESAKVGEMLSNALNYCLQANEIKEVDVLEFKQFLLSGFFGWKSSYGWVKERNIDDVLTDPVYLDRTGWNNDIRDIRGKDIHTVFEIIDLTIDDLLSQFAKNEADEQLIRDWYGMSGSKRVNVYQGILAQSGLEEAESVDFLVPTDISKCRVFEIWKTKLEKVLIVHDHSTGEVYEETEMTPAEIDALNEQIIQSGLNAGVPLENIPTLEYEERYENVWYFYFLTPWGHILQYGRTPYDHESTPYTLGIYPLVAGEIFGLVDDIIDQQRYINRLVTLYDFLIAFAAKGVLMIPEDSIPDGWTEEDFAEEWVKFNGVITYKPSKTGAKPEQITSRSQPVGIQEMLNMQFTLLKEISGVTDAIQGIKPDSGTPASRYAQETHNASLSNRDFFEFFFTRKKRRDLKIVKLIQQFYDDERYINVGGKDYSEDVDYYRPELAKDAEFEMTMGQSTTSTAYRMMVDDYLMQFLQAGFIDFDTYLANTSMPFADKIRESVRSRMDELQGAMGQGGGAPVNPEVMGMFDQMMGRPQPPAGQIRQPARGVG